MSDRRKYYGPRIVIDHDSLELPETQEILVCLTAQELAMVRPILGYLHRRTTFACEYNDGYYVIPDDETWDNIQAIVAELEYKLMTSCDDIVTQLTAIAGELACLCSAASNPPVAQPGPAYDVVVDSLIEDGTLAIEDDNLDTVPVDAERCALAQVTYAFMFEWMTETIIPAEKVLVDVILPASMGAVGLAIGGPLLGVPAASITAALIALGDLAADNQLESLVNSLFANKEEIVCALYQGLETSYQQAHLDVSEVVNDMASLGYTDKLIVRTLLAPWAMAACQAVIDIPTSWATSHITAGYCVICEDIIEGVDWFAVPDGRTLELTCAPGEGRNWFCLSGDALSGYTVAGYIIEILDNDAAPVFGWTQENYAGCTGTVMSLNTSPFLVTGETYYNYHYGGHDEQDVKSELLPTGVLESGLTQVTGPGNWVISFSYGDNVTSTAHLRLKYIVYEGTL
jgi:hypothetical protein